MTERSMCMCVDVCRVGMAQRVNLIIRNARKHRLNYCRRFNEVVLLVAL